MPESSATLVLFTHVFPFGEGEPFVGMELPYLAKAFDHVIVVPQWAGEKPRTMPDNVELDTSLAAMNQSGPTRFARYAWRFLTCGGLGEVLRKPRLALSKGAMSHLITHIDQAINTQRWVEEAKGVNPTLFYSYWLGSQTMGVGRANRLWASGGLLTVPLVSRAHGTDLYEHAVPWRYKPMQRRTIESAGRLYLIAEHGIDYVKTRYPHLADRCNLARLGVAGGQRARASDDGVFRLLSVSAVREVKRLDRVIAALSVLARQRADLRVEWTHIGDGPLRDELEAMAETQLRDTRIACHWLGPKRNAEVRRHYESHPVDALINTSHSEGLPVSMMEAHAHGVPIIALDVGGVSEIVNTAEHERTGVLLPADAPAERLAEAIADLADQNANDPAARDAMRDRCHANWAQRFDADRNLRDFAKHLRGALGE